MAEPDCDGGNDDFGSVVGDAFGVAGGEATELFQAVEAAFDDVALLVDGGVEARWPAAGWTSGLAAGDLVGPFRAGEADPETSHRPAGRGVRVRLVSDHPAGPASWSAAPGRADADLIEQRQQLRVVTGLAWGDQDRHRPAAAVHGEVDLGGQPAPRASEPFALDRKVLDPGGAGTPFFRAPAACWCARTLLESTEKTHSTWPIESSLTMTSSRTRSHVPSAVQRRSRSWQVFQGPYRSGRSRHGAPVRSCQRIPLITCR